MNPSIHFYVLSLCDKTTRLYEGFRDKFIDIQNTNFPLGISTDTANPESKNTQLRKFFTLTDEHFAHYYQQDPLPLVIVGEENNLAIFLALTTHREAILGTVKGHYSGTSLHDLGKIVWPVVKEAISGIGNNAMHDLAAAAEANKVVSGIDAVGQSMETEIGSTLYVEEDYHVRGSICKTHHSLIISKHVNIWEVIDDVVDVIIEQVLRMGGTVIFLNKGSLLKLERIAMILSN